MRWVCDTVINYVFCFNDTETEATATARVSRTKPSSDKSTVFMLLYFTLYVQSNRRLSEIIHSLFINYFAFNKFPCNRTRGIVERTPFYCLFVCLVCIVC